MTDRIEEQIISRVEQDSHVSLTHTHSRPKCEGVRPCTFLCVCPVCCLRRNTLTFPCERNEEGVVSLNR